MADLQHKIVGTDKELTDAFSIRDIVFIQEQQVPKEIEMDEHDDTATHFIIYDGELPIATARIRPYGEDTAKVERFAVLKEYRGTGVGASLMNFIEAEAHKMGYHHFRLNSQKHAENFYAKLGFNPIGEPFYEANIEHITMQK